MNKNPLPSHLKTLLIRISLVSVVATLCACGFRPVYKKDSYIVTNGMNNIYVVRIDGRFGQQVRQYLQQLLIGSDTDNPSKDELTVQPSFTQEYIDIHPDNTSGRVRVTGKAHWTLSSLASTPKIFAEGDVRTLDGYDILYEQYFAQNLSAITIQDRVASNLAENIVYQLASWFEHRTQQQLPPLSNKPTTTSPITGSMIEQPNTKPGTDGVPAIATGRS